MKYYCVVNTFRKLRNIQSLARYQSSKVPSVPVQTFDKNQDSEKVTVGENTIALLKRLSLVEEANPIGGVLILEDSIAFANQILHINTDHVEPLYSVLEQRSLSLRSDKITQGNCQKDILKNAAVKEDDYFVAP